MRKHECIDYTNIRKKVSKLFKAVLTRKLTVREALLKFPDDCDDKTLIACWHALCHLESDEELRLKDSMYKQEQDEYIKFIVSTLEKGEELPQNIINEYLPYYNDALIPQKNNTIKGILHQIKKFLCC